MLKQQARLFSKIAMIVDIVMIIMAFYISYWLAGRYAALHDSDHYYWILFAEVPIWLFLLYRYKLYASLRTSCVSTIISSAFKAFFWAGIWTASLIFLVEPKGYSRLFFILTFVNSFLLICAAKLVIRMLLSFVRRRGHNVRFLLIVGMGPRSVEMTELIRHHSCWGLHIIGFVSDKERCDGSFLGYPVVGSIGDLVAFCREHTVDEVIWCSEQNGLETENIFFDLTDMGITFRTVLDYSKLPVLRTELSLFHERVPIITYYPKEFDATQLLLKRCLDVVGALVGLALLLLMLPVLAIVIRIDSPGPLFFSQMRVGRNGRPFRCWKFRSMYRDAETRKQQLMAQNEMQGAMFKMADDPRITRVGKFIRKTSIDELPQFWNVLRGEMSLVGTRPPTPDEVATYENWHHKRICIKPGITGLWQVSGRNKIKDFDQVVRLDIQYIESWSIWLDIKILIKTFWVVFARRGAS